MQIEQLFVYPIKSLGGVSLHSAKLEPRGLALDRRWMLVDANGVFITQRKYPQLSLFEISIEKTKLIVTSGINGHQMDIPFTPVGDKISVRVWDDMVEAIEVSDEVSNWFTQEVGEKLKLVFMPEVTQRLIDPKYALDSETVSFADGYPVLVVNSASVKDINKRLDSLVSVSRFRPNIVVSGKIAFEEDQWTHLRAGEVELKLVKKCARCVVINIDPETGEKNANVLGELSNYRKEGNKVYFGINAIPVTSGQLKVGDQIKVS